MYLKSVARNIVIFKIVSRARFLRHSIVNVRLDSESNLSNESAFITKMETCLVSNLWRMHRIPLIYLKPGTLYSDAIVPAFVVVLSCTDYRGYNHGLDGIE